MRVTLMKPLVREAFLRDSMKSQYLGFSMLRAYLLREERDVDVRVACTAEAIADQQPDLVGLSSVTEMWPRAVATARGLRAGGYAGPLVIGGPHVTALPETLPPEADVAVLGEGEAVLLDLVRAYRKSRRPRLDEIAGIAFRDPEGRLVQTPRRGVLELDALPMDLHENPSAVFQISTVRGCPFHCRHCVERPTQGGVRFLSAERLVWLMQERVRLTGNRHFFFQDDTFLAAPGRLEQLHELLRRKNLMGRFVIHSVSLNANLVREETIPLLKEIGVQRMGMGCESFNPRVLKEMKRGVLNLEHFERAIRWAGRAGLPLGGSQVYGYPGETRDEMIDSIRRVQRLERTTIFHHWLCYVCQPLPGSDLWKEQQAAGNVSLEMDFSRLRIDGDYEHFDSPWYYMNEANVPREEFLDILERFGQLPPGFFAPPRWTSWNVQRTLRAPWRAAKAAVRRALRAVGCEIRRLPS
jgi:radical SAM superfamily enzyme YgiQ (UPF0313 family)